MALQRIMWPARRSEGRRSLQGVSAPLVLQATSLESARMPFIMEFRLFELPGPPEFAFMVARVSWQMSMRQSK